MNQASDFAEALCQYVDEQLRYQDGEYILGAVRIIDARNHLFAAMLHQNTDEEADIYALRDLCHINEDTMETESDINRALCVARNYF